MKRLFFGRRSKKEDVTPPVQGLGITRNDDSLAKRQVAFASDSSPGRIASPALSVPAPSKPKARRPSDIQSTPNLDGAPLLTLNTSVINNASPSHLYLSRDPSSTVNTFSRLANLSREGASGSQIFQPVTWSEMADDDLVDNIGNRERTRQEVLWEIVASEERYVQELLLLKEHYIDPLLGSTASTVNSSPKGTLSPPMKPMYALRAVSPNRFGTNPSSDNLPIAAKFQRRNSLGGSTLGRADDQTLVPDMDMVQFGHRLPSADTSLGSDDTHPRGSSASLAQYADRQRGGAQSTPPLQKSTFRHHLKSLTPTPPNKLHRSKHSTPASAHATPALPHALLVLLQTVADHLVPGHEQLCAKLRQRYEEQYPLVRSLTDVFTDQTWIIQHYATYVLHLEKALAVIEDTLSTVHSKKFKSAKAGDLREEKKLATLIMHLEELAAMRGGANLQICLSQPFQRLLKYPLLFNNLLFHTDASLREYESTERMALQIDQIVKSIENEKVSEEERLKSRDFWARIEGVSDKTLMAPRSDRCLLSEEPIWQSQGDRRTFSDASHAPPHFPDQLLPPPLIKERRMFRQSSQYPANKNDKRPSMGSKKDLWLITFTDVVIRCQRIGKTQIPTAILEQKTWKEAKKTKTIASAPERNLYRFLKVESWNMRADTMVKPGIVSMEHIKKRMQPHHDDVLTETEDESEDADKHCSSSKMSFIYTEDVPRPALEPVTANIPSFSSSPADLRISQNTTTAFKKPANSSKFANRVRPVSRESSPASQSQTRIKQHHFAAPTAASSARAQSPLPPSQRPISPFANQSRMLPRARVSSHGNANVLQDKAKMRRASNASAPPIPLSTTSESPVNDPESLPVPNPPSTDRPSMNTSQHRLPSTHSDMLMLRSFWDNQSKSSTSLSNLTRPPPPR